jgi:hypothetical protein
MDLSFILLLCIFLCFVLKKKVLRIINFIILGVVVLFGILILSVPIEVMKESSIFKVDDSKTFNLVYSDDYIISLEQDTFYKSEVLYFRGSSEEDINIWLADNGSNICLKISSSNEVLYNKSLSRDITGKDIIKLINDWRNTNTLPSSHRRYWIFCFYLEWKL